MSLIEFDDFTEMSMVVQATLVSMSLCGMLLAVGGTELLVGGILNALLGVSIAFWLDHHPYTLDEIGDLCSPW